MKELFGSKNKTALKVGGLYLVFGTLWILVSDKVLHFLIEEERMVEGFQTLKGTLFVLLSAILIFFTVRYETNRREQIQRDLIRMEERTKEEALKAGEEERNRISAELHDGIQQQLAGISLMIERIKDECSEEQLENLKEEVRNCIEEIRCISHSMSSYRLDQKGLKTAMEELSASDAIGRAIPFKLHIGILDEHPFDYFTAMNLYRIVQELLLNVSKHSAAERIELSIQEHEEDRFLFHYRESGPVEKLEESKGLGKRSIQKRIDCLNGETLRWTDRENVRELAFSFYDKQLSQALLSKDKELQIS